jgi:hypothetical protein
VSIGDRIVSVDCGNPGKRLSRFQRRIASVAPESIEAAIVEIPRRTKDCDCRRHPPPHAGGCEAGLAHNGNVFPRRENGRILTLPPIATRPERGVHAA